MSEIPDRRPPDFRSSPSDLTPAIKSHHHFVSVIIRYFCVIRVSGLSRQPHSDRQTTTFNKFRRGGTGGTGGTVLLEPGAGNDQSQWFRRKKYTMIAPRIAMTVSAAKYPYSQPSSGMFSKFIP